MPETFLSQKEAAERLGISARHLSRLKDEGHIGALELPGERWPKYPWPRIRDEFARYQATLQEEPEPQPGEGRKSAAQREQEARAAIKEMEAARMAGQLVPREVHLEVVRRILDLFQTKMTAVPGRWASEIVGIEDRKEAVGRLRLVVNEILEELQSAGKELENGNGKEGRG